MSSTTLNVSQYLLDYGSNYRPGDGNAQHDAVPRLERRAGLRRRNDSILLGDWTAITTFTVAATDKNLQQATINLFADMGAQPGSLMKGLIRAFASTDTLAPISTITSPIAGIALQVGVAVTVRGTAQDRGGGTVAAVEVSVDGGLTWHRATGPRKLDLHLHPAQQRRIHHRQPGSR